MVRRKLIAGNWKMNGTRASTSHLLAILAQGYSASLEVELVIFPPYVFLSEIQQQLNSTHIAWGAQNISDQLEGAYTGEISASMLLEFGCSYVLVGHSERRLLYCESNERVAQKFMRACQSGIVPILCVGETMAQQEAGQTLSAIEQQLAAVLKMVDNLSKLEHAVIAYEPVWAIGTGQVATPEQAQAVHAAIRAQLANHHPSLADSVRIVYGGSVNAKNAAALFAQPDIDGGLVGGASLDGQQFLEITQQCRKLF